MTEKIRVKIVSDRYDNTSQLMDALNPHELTGAKPQKEVEHEHTERTAEAELIREGGKTAIKYTESEISGMDGAVTEIFFFDDAPKIVMMERGGAFKTSFVFEGGKRHICVYETPIMPFEVSVQTKKVVNGIEKDGNLRLEYTVELRGANAERTRFSMQLRPVYDKPAGAGA